MASIFDKSFFSGLFGKKASTKKVPVEDLPNERTYPEGLARYKQGQKDKVSSPMGSPILDRYYKNMEKLEERLEKGKSIKQNKPFSKRYMFDDDLGQRATAKNRLPNAETSGWTGLYTGRQMEEADESIDAPDINTADIESTAISRYRYNPKTGNLYIKFKGNNKEYLFPRVPKEAVKGLLNATSKGEYYNKNLKQYAVSPMEAMKIVRKTRGK